jgi:predicted NBD/HSP70 family sugar kinase
MHKPTARDIRRTNRLTVLQHIYALGSASRQELATLSGLSTATVANVVTDLLVAEIIVEAGFEDPLGGRPRAILTVNKQHKYFVGIDVSETYIHCELFDLTLRHLHMVELALSPEENQPDQVVERLLLGLKRLLEEARTSQSAVLGIGISVPGIVERSGGVSIFAPNWGWHNVALLTVLKRHIDLPLFLDNPLKASALAELWFGAGRKVDNLLTLIIGTGVGAGIILNGNVYRGPTNSAGEWGHTPIVLDGWQCRCGNKGCLEAYVGGPGIMRRLREYAPTSDLLHEGDQTATILALAEAAQQDDPIAQHVIRETAHYLGAGIASLINLFNPQLVLLSSWISNQLGPYFLQALPEFVSRYALKQTLDATRIELSQLAHNPVSMGVATLALEGYLATISKPMVSRTSQMIGNAIAADGVG